MKDLYKILGVSENADADTIKKAYRKLAKENHPDATGGDKKKTERFKEAGEAYDVLGDDKKRREYDRLRHAPVGSDGMPQGFDPDTFAQVFGGAGGGGFRGGNVHVSGGDFGDMGDLFSSLFGGRAGMGGGGRARAARGPDMSATVEVNFREGALGTQRTIRTGSGGQQTIRIPPVQPGQAALKVAGLGGAAPRGGSPGDLYLEVVVTPDPHLTRSGDDVELTLPLTIAEAVLGTKVEVPTVDGPTTITVPPGTSSGAALRLRGKGAKRPDGARGDQLCRLKIVVPKLAADDAETKTLVEELDRRTRTGAVRNF